MVLSTSLMLLLPIGTTVLSGPTVDVGVMDPGTVRPTAENGFATMFVGNARLVIKDILEDQRSPTGLIASFMIHVLATVMVLGIVPPKMENGFVRINVWNVR